MTEVARKSTKKRVRMAPTTRGRRRARKRGTTPPKRDAEKPITESDDDESDDDEVPASVPMSAEELDKLRGGLTESELQLLLQ